MIALSPSIVRRTALRQTCGAPNSAYLVKEVV